jgi:diaminohydroxyphosphoribosylaminopyrimidine deaminase/5-amino-6-(5-phosphoribosylamino)uracil reductase
MGDPNPRVSGAKILKKAGIAVKGPTNQKKAEAINKEYVRRIKKKPLVAIKAAMSADGRTATRTGDSKWISSKEARKFVHKLRSEYDAVMVGAGTVKADDPRLTSRIKGGRNPIRIIVDGDLCIPLNCKVLKRKDGKSIIATSEKASMKRIKEFARKSRSHVFVCGKKEVDLCALVDVLGSMGIKKILIEGGSELNAKALEAGIVNKFYLSVSPKIIGGRDAIGVIGGSGIELIKDAKKLKKMKVRVVSGDILLEYDL